MSSCCRQCEGIEQTFNTEFAQDDLKAYRKNGPEKTTEWLLKRLKREAIDGGTLLDIGGGVGAIQFELLQAGVAHATSVDASTAYLNTAQQEAERKGMDARITQHHGDFVDIAGALEPTDIVTLDRVICCYPDMPALVGKSARLARRFYGVVYPRDAWYIRLAEKLGTVLLWLSRNPFRFFVHPTEAVESILQTEGFKRVFHRQGFLWQVAVFERSEV